MAFFEVSLTEGTCCWGGGFFFPNWGSRCTMTRDFPVLFKGEYWSKPDLVMCSPLFLFLFSFDVNILKLS